MARRHLQFLIALVLCTAGSLCAQNCAAYERVGADKLGEVNAAANAGDFEGAYQKILTTQDFLVSASNQCPTDEFLLTEIFYSGALLTALAARTGRCAYSRATLTTLETHYPGFIAVIPRERDHVSTILNNARRTYNQFCGGTS